MTNIPALSQKIERLKAQKTRLAYLEKKQVHRNRKARTRTLIQLGGLINMLELLDHVDITLEENLEEDQKHKDKAATLLGMLLHLQESLPQELSVKQREAFLHKGITFLKMREYKKLIQ